MARARKEKEPKAVASKGIIKLPLGKCLTAPNSRFYADLKAAALSLARARNAMARHWQRFQEDNAFHDAAYRQEYYAGWIASEPKEVSEGLAGRWAKWLKGGGFTPPVVCYEDRWLTFEGVLYNVGRAFVRTPEGGIPISHLDGGLLTPCAKDVSKDLLAKTSYRHSGAAQYRWQGVLTGEMQLSDYGNSLSVPVKNNDGILAWDYERSPSFLKATRSEKQHVDRFAGSQCVLLLPLFSRLAGRRKLFHVVRINTRFLPEGMKAVIHKVIRGQWKWSDSYLHFDEARPNSKKARKGHKSRWYLHLCYEQPAGESVVDAKREGYLKLNDPASADPFEVGVSEKTLAEFYADVQSPRPWQCGNGVPLKRVLAQSARKRQEWQFRHKARGDGRRSHGHRREYRDVRDALRGERSLVMDNRRKTCAEIVRYCVKHRLGVLNFDVPKLGARASSWFSRNDVPITWDNFVADLRYECEGSRVKLVTPKDVAYEKAKAKRALEPVGSSE